MMNSEDLRFFCTVANSDTLAMAARTLDVTPPNVTQRLQALEKKTGFKLIQRPSRKVNLTDEGWIIFERAKRIIEDLNSLNDQIDDRKGHVSGKLRILAPLGFGAEYIAPIVTEYRKHHPLTEIELSLSDIPSWSNFHEWDVIIYIGELKNSSLHCIKLCNNQRYLCASPAYLATYGIPASPHELINHQCIALRENDEDVTLWKFEDQGTSVSVRIHPWLSSNNGKTVKYWALEDQGIILRSGWDVKKDIEAGRLMPLLCEYDLPRADIVALTSYSMMSRPPRVQLFLELLKQRLGEMSFVSNYV